MKENLLTQLDGRGWSPSSESRTDVHGTLFLWRESFSREREGRGQDKWWDWKSRSRHTSTYLENLKRLRVEGIGGGVCVVAVGFLLCYVG